jgi:hypothetical protein
MNKMTKVILKKTEKGTLEFKEGNIEDLVNLLKSKIPEPFEKNVAYIICPDLNCNGFYEDNMQCLKMSEKYGPMCPKKDEAYRIHLCYYNHHIKIPINKSQWQRLHCDECESETFQSGKNYWRISKEDYENWVKENEK